MFFVSNLYFRIVILYISSRCIYINVYGVKTFVFNAFCFRTYVWKLLLSGQTPD